MNRESSGAAETLFYYKVREEKKGPYTLKQLISILEGGQIAADAVYRTSDATEWLPLLPQFLGPKSFTQPAEDLDPELREQTATRSCDNTEGPVNRAAIGGNVASFRSCNCASVEYPRTNTERQNLRGANRRTVEWPQFYWLVLNSQN